MTTNAIDHLKIDDLASRLVSRIGEFEKAVIAFSGGVDSSVVAKAAKIALGESAVAVMSVSPSVPQRQHELAVAVALEVGIDLTRIETGETEREDYRKNDSDRCFFCKETLYAAIENVCQHHPGATILSGTNYDDLGDHRPGIRAGKLASVSTPLADLQIGKQQVRQLARHWGLSVAELPAGPCLASRIAYGEPVTVEKLSMIDQAEDWLRDQGFRNVRVRFHPGIHARIEVDSSRTCELHVEPVRSQLATEFRRLGFRFVSVDIDGFRSGNLNQLLTITTKPH